jgi:hypothetical protein
MKKLILILVAFATLISCSKSDSPTEVANKPLSLNRENMVGRWTFTSTIKENGNVIPFVGQCPSKTDWVDISILGKISPFLYYADCVNTRNDYFEGYYFEGNLLKNTNNNEFFSDARVTILTSNTLRIEYDTPHSISILPLANYKGFILNK